MANDLSELLNLLNEVSDSNVVDADSDLYITGIKEAEKMIDRKLSFGKTREVQQIIDYITTPSNNVTGSSDQYHNLVSSLLTFGNYPATLQICDYALQKYPYSVDILANVINASGKSGNFEKGLEYLKTAKKISKEYWNWRLFVFAIDFYQEYLHACPRDKVEEIWATAMELAADFQKTLPMDERSYNEQAELYLFKHDYDAARLTLRDAIFNTHGTDYQGNPIYLVAAQCCVTYLTDILDDSQDYEEIIKVADKGLQFTTQEQPSARIGYFVYRKALAMDAKCVSTGYIIPPDITNALRQYQCAYKLNIDKAYAKTIKSRFHILCQNPINPVSDMLLEPHAQDNATEESDQ